MSIPSTTALLFCLSGLQALVAAPITVTGNYVQATFTDIGTIRNLWYDPNGTRIFGPTNDYIIPGTPFEGFGVTASSSNSGNANVGAFDIMGSITPSPGGSTGGSVTWSGLTAQFGITHLFWFGNNDRRVNITTTLTAFQNLTGVSVSRAVDPDPDNYPGGSANTNNQRGNTTLGLSTSDFVGSVGQISGLPLGLLYQGSLSHNTGIASFCCSVLSPAFYLAGGDMGDSSSGDDGIGIAFDLGDMTAGSSVTWTYAYVMGDSIDSIDTGVPEPSTMALAATALLALKYFRRHP